MADSTEKVKKQSFFKGVQLEFKKINWPDKNTMIKQSIAVVVISLIAGVLITVIDHVAQYGVNFLTSIK